MIKQTLLALACCLGMSMAPAGSALAAVDVNSADEAALTTVKGKRSFEGVPCGRRRYPLGVLNRPGFCGGSHS